MKETIHSASPVVLNQNSQHHLVRTVSFEISPFGTFWCSSISLDQVNLMQGHRICTKDLQVCNAPTCSQDACKTMTIYEVPCHVLSCERWSLRTKSMRCLG